MPARLNKEPMKSLPKVKIYTDGSCLKNPGPGGIGVIIVHEDGAEIEISRGYPSTTNNRMEMQAAIEGLKALKAPSEATIYSDSLLLINCATGKWKRNKNLDLWKQLDAESRKHRVSYEKVKGHSTDRLNNRCDELAGDAARGVQIQRRKPLPISLPAYAAPASFGLVNT